ncbi:unnamed protein product [Thelazia callipaeda]|uniref:BAH domain-containing protein n=1 Tax=Thelazia callipaeda TaxID=103827 RepID=A0A0N5CZX5_THECL|nr:unnamed protein product [Thelazia callipaeda]
MYNEKNAHPVDGVRKKSNTLSVIKKSSRKSRHTKRNIVRKKPKGRKKVANSRKFAEGSLIRRSLTPSLDPKLLRQFEQEDRPKRVLRSATTVTSNSGTDCKNNHRADRSTSMNVTHTKYALKDSNLKSKKFTSEVFTEKNTDFVKLLDRNQIQRKRSYSKSGNKSGKAKKRSRKVLRENDSAVADVIGTLSDSSPQSNLNGFSIASNSSDVFKILSRVGRRCRIPAKTQTTSINSNWKLTGKACRKTVYINSFHSLHCSPKQLCYPEAVHSKTGDILRSRYCVRVNSTDGEPNFAYICHLFNDPDTGVPSATILWYYTAVQIKSETSSMPKADERELFASKHIDIIPLDAIDEIVYILTFNEYNRFMAETTNDAYPPSQQISEESLLWRKGEDNYPRRKLLPRDDTPLELVSFLSKRTMII